MKWLIALVCMVVVSVSAYACPLQFYPNPTGTLTGGALFWNGRADVVSTGVGKVVTKYDVWFHPSLGNKKPKQYKAGQMINITVPGIFQAGGNYIILQIVK